MESNLTKSTRKHDFMLVLFAHIVFILVIFASFINNYVVKAITNFLPCVFLVLFLFQKNKKYELQQLFSIRDWKRPFLYVMICISFTYLYVHEKALKLPLYYILALIIWLLIQAFDEEYVFRYLFLTKLHGSTICKVLISSILFTLLHYILPENRTSITFFFWQTILFRFLFGVVLCYFYLHHHSIYEITIMHCLSNVFNFLCFHSVYDYFTLLVFFILFENRRWFFDWIKKVKQIA